jgi:polysaccharide biosynthesis transport protein
MQRSTISGASPARAYWLFALGFGLAGALLALAISLAVPPQYEARAKLYVSTVGGGPNPSAYEESAASQEIALSLAKLASSEAITDRVVRRLQLDMSASELASKIVATVEPETVVINLSFVDSSPATAREVTNATALEFSHFVDELHVNAAQSTPRPQVTLVQPALTPSVPISPNVARNVGLGMLAGLAVGLVFSNLRERTNRTVRDFHTLERIVGRPPLGVIPIFRSRNGRSVAVVASDQSAMEGFKEVRTNLHHALDERSRRILCVTSAGLKEGKTTTVIGLAIALSDAGHKVVVVDSDLRRADLSRQLELANSEGLTEVLSDGLEVDDVIHPSGLPRIDAISSGHPSHQPSELLTSEKAALLFRLLAERYDFVLIDTPALLAFTDAAVVADHSDGVVLVARYAHVESNDLESAVASLQRVQARILGPVFTFAPVSESRRRSVKPRRGWMKFGVESRPRWLVAADDAERNAEQHSSYTRSSHAGLEGELRPLRELDVEVEYRDRRDTTAERDGDDDRVRVAGEGRFAERPGPQHPHGAEQRQSGTTHNGYWRQRARLWEQAQQDQDAASTGDYEPALDGYRYQTNVLDERVEQAEEIAAADTEEIAAADTEEIAAADTEEIAAADTEEIAAGDTEEIAAGDTEEIAAGDTEEIAAADTEEIAAADTEEIAAADTEEIAQVSRTGVEQRYERETGTLTKYTDEPDFDADWSHESKPDNVSWPLLEYERDFGANGGADNRTLDRQPRSLRRVTTSRKKRRNRVNTVAIKKGGRTP